MSTLVWVALAVVIWTFIATLAICLAVIAGRADRRAYEAFNDVSTRGGRPECSD